MDSRRMSRRYVLATGAGLAAAGAMAGAGVARAAGQPRAALVDPDIDSTAQWNARPPGGTVNVLNTRPDRIVVHHTVGENSSDLSRAQAHRHAHWVQDLHMDDNGWIDTGYHFLVSRGGWITEGRHRSLSTLHAGSGLVLGAHTSGQNERAIGIANEGAYHDGATPPAAQWEVLVLMCAYVCRQYGINPTQIFGHKDFGDTLCPGVIHDRLPQLRREVAEQLP